jgi:hypothetical protein
MVVMKLLLLNEDLEYADYVVLKWKESGTMSRKKTKKGKPATIISQ